MTVCNSATVHGVFISEVSLVKHSQTRPACCLVAGFVSWMRTCLCSSLEHTNDFSELGQALKATPCILLLVSN